MRVRVRLLALLVLAALLAGCSAVSSAAASPSAKGTAAASPRAAGQGLPGLLPVPAGARPWTTNTNAQLGRVAFVHAFYVQKGWTSEAALYLRRGFVTGAAEGWINADGSQQSIAIIRFASAVGAESTYDDFTASWTDDYTNVTMLSDTAVTGAVGMSDPTLDTYGNARVEFAVVVGDEVIDVHEYTAATPDPAAARALLLKQYDAVKNSA